MIPATLWNSTPRDDKGHRGTIEEALVGSFDPLTRDWVVPCTCCTQRPVKNMLFT
ncbi:hypothetical protein ADUPG1_005769, partial [Aduncisulcus paluster]